MNADRASLTTYLSVASPSKTWARDRLLELLVKQRSFPSFSAAVLKLMKMAQDDEVGIHQLAAIISREPGLAANCIHAAAAARYGLGVVRSVEDAAMRLGAQEIRRVACSLGAMDRFSHLRVKVDWNKFWLHSLLVARFSDRVAGAFRQASGTEYLAGLLHDTGKLIVEHYFPREFEGVLERSWSTKRPHFVAERDLLGVDHAQIGAAICHCLRVHPHVRSAVWFHHFPTEPRSIAQSGGDQGFLAAVVGFADALAHMCSESLGGERASGIPFDQLPEWRQLQRFDPVHGLELDTDWEVAEAEADLKAFSA